MNLKAVLYIDDDGLGGTLSIFDEPCSEPNHVHADVRLSPGTVACVLEYITHGIAIPDSKRMWTAVHRREAEDATVTFMPSRMDVSLYDKPRQWLPTLGLLATFHIQRGNVLVDMSNEWGEPTDEEYISWCSPEGA